MWIPIAVVNEGVSDVVIEAPPVAGYTGWWSAADTDSIVVGSSLRMQSWKDLSGSEHHLASGHWVPPFYGTRTMNGILVPDFASSWMTCFSPRDDRSSCLFVVAEVDTIAAGNRTIIGSNSTGAAHMRTSADEFQCTTSAVLIAQIDNIVVASSPFIGVLNLTAGACEIHYTDTEETDANGTALTAGRVMAVGWNAVNGEPWDGAIAEIIYYPSTLSAGDITSVKDYLKARWGIA